MDPNKKDPHQKEKETQGERFEGQDERGGRPASEKRDEEVVFPVKEEDEGKAGSANEIKRR